MSVYNYPNGGQDSPNRDNGGNGRGQQPNGNNSTNGYGSTHAGSTYGGGSTYGSGSTYGGSQAPSNGGGGGVPGYPQGYASSYRSGTYPAAGGDWTPSLALDYMTRRPPNGANPHAGPYGGPTYNDVNRAPEESMGGHWPGTNGAHAGLHGRHGYGGYWPGTTPQGGGYMPERGADIARYNAAAGQYGTNNIYGDPDRPRIPPWMGGGNGEGHGRGRGGP